MKEPTNFSYHLSNFLTVFLAGQRNVSKNTIKSYRDTFVLLLKYYDEGKNIPPEKIHLAMIHNSEIESFLNWLEIVRSNSISTRNQRLAAIHAFFRYVQGECPELLFHCQKILSIKSKRNIKNSIDYLSEKKIMEILSAPDTTLFYGRRDATLLTTLYDSGCRVQEIVDLKVRDVRLEPPSMISVLGKGRKSRHVPIMDSTALLLKSYLNENMLITADKLDYPVFFNHKKHKLTRQGVSYIINKYVDDRKISPHILRHSKAVHMMNAEINIIYIRDFLGHSSITTTEVYAKASTELKLKALEKAQNLVKTPVSVKDWNDDRDLMSYLKNLI